MGVNTLGLIDMSERKKLADILPTNSERDQLASAWSTTKAAADLIPLPPGAYRCRVVDGSLFNAKSGTAGYKLTLQVLEGEHAGRRLWHELWFSPAALAMTKRDLAKLGIECPEQLEKPLPPGIIVAVKVTLQRDDDGNERNRLKAIEVVEIRPPEADPFAPCDQESEGADTRGFDWRNGEQRNGVLTQ
jgi:hypothetical protein